MSTTNEMEHVEETYCICNSKDDKRFMICCDSCNRWFHGDCINVKTDQAKKMKHFYCSQCRTDKKLSIVFKQRTSSSVAGNDSDSEPAKKRQKVECGICIGCFRTEDCGRCDICKENQADASSPAVVAYRKKCRLRQCVSAQQNEKSLPTKKPALENIKSKIPPGGAKLKNVSKKKPATSSAPLTVLPQHVSTVQSSAAFFTTINSRALLLPPAGKTRGGAKAYKDFMIEAGLLNDDEPEDVRQCLGPGCVLPARSGSKYCSDEACGMKLAKARLVEILPGRLQQWRRSPSIAEQFEQKRLENIEVQMEDARQKLANYVREEEKLNGWLNEAEKIKADADAEPDDEEDAESNVYCTTCGHETSAKTAFRHIMRCFNKYESQTSYGSAHRTYNNIYNIFCDAYNKTSRTYCKRLRVICPEHCKDAKIEDDDICAYPLQTDNTLLDSFAESVACLVPKKICMKHYKWDKIRRALIDMERLGQLLKLDELFEEQKALKTSIAARGNLLSLLLHQTIKHEENPNNEVPILVE